MDYLDYTNLKKKRTKKIEELLKYNMLKIKNWIQKFRKANQTIGSAFAESSHQFEPSDNFESAKVCQDENSALDERLVGVTLIVDRRNRLQNNAFLTEFFYFFDNNLIAKAMSNV
ncbi:hypothetical protein Mgra_00008622 [Meloidogyne graminicola]|uniref:Uncharacterized protein n=1 Tax=Meloidogyne graminicola TaxID=189291 RepID=A0A8S9ZF51_9BILA|nr:hypothetical protein Mgra_00008622 [Meloidogyne graminicola]